MTGHTLCRRARCFTAVSPCCEYFSWLTTYCICVDNWTDHYQRWSHSVSTGEIYTQTPKLSISDPKCCTRLQHIHTSVKWHGWQVFSVSIYTKWSTTPSLWEQHWSVHTTNTSEQVWFWPVKNMVWQNKNKLELTTFIHFFLTNSHRAPPSPITLTHTRWVEARGMALKHILIHKKPVLAQAPLWARPYDSGPRTTGNKSI